MLEKSGVEVSNWKYWLNYILKKTDNFLYLFTFLKIPIYTKKKYYNNKKGSRLSWVI